MTERSETQRHRMLKQLLILHAHSGSVIEEGMTPKDIIDKRNFEGSSNCADSTSQMVKEALVRTLLDLWKREAAVFTNHLRDSQAEYRPTKEAVAGWFRTFYPDGTDENVPLEDAKALLGYDNIRAENAKKRIQEIIAQRTEIGLPAEIINGTETSVRPVIKDGKVVGVLFDSNMVNEGEFDLVIASIHYPSVPSIEDVNKDPHMYSDLAIEAAKTGKINIFGHLTSLSQFYPARLELQRVCEAFREHQVTLEVNLGTAFNYIQDIFMNKNIYPNVKPGEENIWIKDLETLLRYNPSEEDRNRPQSEALEKLGISPNLINYVKAKEEAKRVKGQDDKRALDLPFIPLLSDPEIRGILKDQIGQGLTISVDLDLHKLPKTIEKSVSEEGKEYPEMMPLRFTEAAIVFERRFNELFQEMGVDPEKSVINLWPVEELKKWLKKED